MPTEKENDARDPQLNGLENVREAARDLANRLRDTTVSIGEFATDELAFAVGIAEDIRDRAVSPELLKEAQALPVLRSLRQTSHRVVDLGFDAVSVGVKLGSDAVDDFLLPRQPAKAIAQSA